MGEGIGVRAYTAQNAHLNPLPVERRERRCSLGSPLRFTFFARFPQCLANAFGVEVGGVDWRAGLLPPRFVQPAGIDAVEAKFIDEL